MNNFHPVSTVMLSPNFWGENKHGNKHYLFLIANCKNPDSARGFYNEMLRPELMPERKLFEVLGSRMNTGISDKQLSGFGFSYSQSDSLIVKVTGKFTRLIKIVF